MNKKLFLAAAAAFMLVAGTAQAQHLDLGLNGGFGPTWMFNGNVSDQADNLDYSSSFGSTFGLNAGYYFASPVGVELELNYTTVNQKYSGTAPGVSYTGKDMMSYFEVPLMLRIGKGGFFFEAGPKFSFLTGAKGDFTSSPADPFDHKGSNIKPGMKSTMISGTFGLGGSFGVTENIFINARLRFSYGFTDATKEYTDEHALNVLAAGNFIGVGDYYAHYKQDDVTFSYKESHIATGFLMVGVSYRLPM